MGSGERGALPVNRAFFRFLFGAAASAVLALGAIVSSHASVEASQERDSGAVLQTLTQSTPDDGSDEVDVEDGEAPPPLVVLGDGVLKVKRFTIAASQTLIVKGNAVIDASEWIRIRGPVLLWPGASLMLQGRRQVVMVGGMRPATAAEIGTLSPSPPMAGANMATSSASPADPAGPTTSSPSGVISPGSVTIGGSIRTGRGQDYVAAADHLTVFGFIDAGHGADAASPDQVGGNGGSIHIDDDVATADFSARYGTSLTRAAVTVDLSAGVLGLEGGRGGDGWRDFTGARIGTNLCHEHGNGLFLKGTDGGNGGGVFLTPTELRFVGTKPRGFPEEIRFSPGFGGTGGTVVGAAADGSLDHAGDDVTFITGSGGDPGSVKTPANLAGHPIFIKDVDGGSAGSADVRAGNGGGATSGIAACDGGEINGRLGTPRNMKTPGASIVINAGGIGGPGSPDGPKDGGRGGDVKLDGGPRPANTFFRVRDASSGGVGAGTCETNPVGGSGGPGGTLDISASLAALLHPLTFSPGVAGSFNGGHGGDDSGKGGDAGKPVQPIPATLTTSNSFLAGLPGRVCPKVNVFISMTPGGSVTITPPGTTCPTDCQVPVTKNQDETATATPDLNHLFSGWGSGPCFGSMADVCRWQATQDVTLEPIWLPITHQLTVNIAGSGSVKGGPIDCPSSCVASLPANSSQDLIATPSPGWSFKGWSGACQGPTATCSVPMTMDQVVSATFIPRLTVAIGGNGSGTVDTTPGGIGCPGTCSAPFDTGTVVTVNAHPSTGSFFAGWSGACAGLGACSLTMNQPATVGASFGKLFNLTVTSNGATTQSAPPGIDCPTGGGAGCSALFPEGTSVILSAGATPVLFSGACNGSSCTLVMTGDQSVLVTAQEALTVNVTGPGGVSVNGGLACRATCTTTFDYGSSVSLAPMPDAGSSFNNWSGDCVGTGTCTLTMNAVKSVAATFSSAPTFPITVTISGPAGSTVTGSPTSLSCGGSTCTAMAPGGTVETLTALPAQGASVVGWSGVPCGPSPTCTFTLTGPTNVTLLLQ